jgi:hypothetical protein
MLGTIPASTLAIAHLGSRTASPHRARYIVPLQNHRYRSSLLGGTMPFINGRYHLNPITGAALEAAREAEAALLALQNHAHRDNSVSPDDSATDASADKAPVHRVEIEASEILPPHSGRATRGFVARIHRSARESPAPAGPGASRAYNSTAMHAALKPETHVFSDHRDLLHFLHDQLSKQ